MRARGDLQPTQDVIHTDGLHLAAVDVGVPRFVEHLREDCQTRRGALALVEQAVGRRVIRQANRGGAVARGQLLPRRQVGLPRLIDDGRVHGVEVVQGHDFLVGRVDPANLVDEPNASGGAGVTLHLRPLIRGDDHVTRVEHVQNVRIDPFSRKMIIDNILIAAQLGGAITSDGLMKVRRLGFVKRTLGQVQNPVIRVFVLQDLLVCLRGHDFACLTLRHKVLIIQKALIHGPEIGKNEQPDHGHHVIRVKRLLQINE